MSMRTFAHTQRPAQRATSEIFIRPGPSLLKQNHKVSSILPLHRTSGNHAAPRLLHDNGEGHENSPLTSKLPHFAHDFSRIPVHTDGRRHIQPKLKVNAPGDIYEREADRVAKQVMSATVQRSCACHGICSQSKTSNVADSVGHIRRVESSGGGTTAAQIVQASVSSFGQPIAQGTRRFMESRFNQDFSQIRIHTDSRANEAARAVQARAFTLGDNIIFGDGEYAPHTANGQHLLAHELVHTLQQKGTPQRVQRALLTCESGEECTARDPDEHTWARGNGIHAAHIGTPEAGFLVWGFPIDSADTTGIDTAPEWGPFSADMMSRDALWQVRGFTDCLGDAALNTHLRQERALNAKNALPTAARQKVVAFFGAPLTDCMAGNATKEERAYNRSAFFQILQENIEFEEGTEVTGGANVYICAKDLDRSPIGNHAFFRIGGTVTGRPTYSLQPENRGSDCWQGIPGYNYASDVSATADCVLTPITLGCLLSEFRAYPIGHYCTLGPNSNTFVGYIARSCGMASPVPPRINVPGWSDSPPPSGTFAPDRNTTLLMGCATKECPGVASGSRFASDG